MSMMKASGEKIVLPRVGADEFWELVRVHYAGDNETRWKALAILALRENAGWPLEVIAQVFGHHRGHVSRILTKVKREMQHTFERSPEWLGFEDPEDCEFDVTANRPEQGFSHPQRTGRQNHAN